MRIVKFCLIALALFGIANAALAQPKPPGYLIAALEITDPDGFQAYAAKVPATLKPFNGRILSRGKPAAIAEGRPPPGVVVVLAFDSLADAQNWWNSPAYQALVAERQRTSRANSIIFMEGVPPS